ncbi:MAG TPA: aminomethyltransferase family protein [Acidobacteriota bacterium]|nr:aminomethyltransferase family protein [Acidobacteriota bacterium]
MSLRSPLHDTESARGARFATYYSREVVEEYAGARSEYEAVRQQAGALDLSYLGKLSATGRDRVRYFHSMLSNDIRNLRDGTGCHATLLTHQGRLESDLYVYSFPEELWVECPPAGADRLFETLNKYIVGDQVLVEDMSDQLAVLSLQGSHSRELLERSVGTSLEDLPLLGHKSIETASGRWVVAHRDRTGCDGYDLWLPSGEASRVWTRWLDFDGIPPVGHLALNWLRTEAGIPWFGSDMGTENLPMEFGLDSAISTTKGCYRGQEIVTRILHRGHLDRRLGAVSVNSTVVPTRGAEVRVQGARAGAVTSAILSPRLGRPLALAILKLDCLKPGTAVEVAYGEASHPGEVVSLPLS